MLFSPCSPAVDQVVFQKRLQQKLLRSPRYPGVSGGSESSAPASSDLQLMLVPSQILQEFISGLEGHVEDPERFRTCLLPCVPRLTDGGPR